MFNTETRDYTFRVAKPKTLVCVFVFADMKSRLFHDMAQFLKRKLRLMIMFVIKCNFNKHDKKLECTASKNGERLELPQ